MSWTKYFIILGLLAIAFTTQAQPTKHEKNWGSDLLKKGTLRLGVAWTPLRSNLSYTTDTPYFSTPFSINAEYFLTNHLAFYASPRWQYRYEDSNWPRIPHSRHLPLGLKLGVNYYLYKEKAWSLYAFMGGQMDYHHFRAVNRPKTIFIQMLSWRAETGLGGNYFVNKRLAIEAKISFTYIHERNIVYTKSESILALYPMLGIKYLVVNKRQFR